MDRAQVGREKVGIPQMEAIEFILDVIDKKGWNDFNRSPVVYYLERMVSDHLISIIDNALDDNSLVNLDPNKVRLINLVLLRDHFRHNANVIRKVDDETWIDEVFEPAFKKFEIKESDYKNFSSKFELEDMSDLQWAIDLSEPFGFMPHKLFITHSSIVTGVNED